MKTYLCRLLKAEEENQWDMELNRIGFAYNVSVHGSTLLSPFEMLYGYRPEYSPNTILECDDPERLRALQISKKYRDSMIEYVKTDLSKADSESTLLGLKKQGRKIGFLEN